jgi:hypothetical protein
MEDGVQKIDKKTFDAFPKGGGEKSGGLLGGISVLLGFRQPLYNPSSV